MEVRGRLLRPLALRKTPNLLVWFLSLGWPVVCRSDPAFGQHGGVRLVDDLLQSIARIPAGLRRSLVHLLEFRFNDIQLRPYLPRPMLPCRCVIRSNIIDITGCLQQSSNSKLRNKKL